ncbi:alpha/beta hydrolase [Dietzia aerolata]|uniref:alpha/beta hydrolase n=1 Tax=Dietzia aerolata TaxID=595984 RepID=UPI00362A163C
MAPRLVRFGRELDRVIEIDCPGAEVTVVGHSYGGRIVGTAERLGLRADRVVYAASPDLGVGVRGAADWRNPGPVRRYSITAPADPVELLQARFALRRRWSRSGERGGVHPVPDATGRVPDTASRVPDAASWESDGVVRLDAGFLTTTRPPPSPCTAPEVTADYSIEVPGHSARWWRSCSVGPLRSGVIGRSTPATRAYAVVSRAGCCR